MYCPSCKKETNHKDYQVVVLGSYLKCENCNKISYHSIRQQGLRLGTMLAAGGIFFQAREPEYIKVEKNPCGEVALMDDIYTIGIEPKYQHIYERKYKIEQKTI